jgi:hypothetical protein
MRRWVKVHALGHLQHFSHAPSGCKKNHLIADNLGWFQDGGTNIEQIMREKGLAITRVKDPTDADTSKHQQNDSVTDGSVFEALGEADYKK